MKKLIFLLKIDSNKSTLERILNQLKVLNEKIKEFESMYLYLRVSLISYRVFGFLNIKYIFLKDM